MSKKRMSYDRIADIRRFLEQSFPATFFGFKQPKLPLKIGIAFDIKVALPELSWRAIESALSDYTRGPTYLGAMKDGAPRIGLDGKPDGVVTPEAASIAKDTYTKVMAYRNAKKRAAADAEATNPQDAEAA